MVSPMTIYANGKSLNYFQVGDFCTIHFDPPPYHPGLPRKGRIYVLAPARWEDSRAIEPYRILEAGASLGLPERPEMRDTLLFSIKKDARSAKIQLQSNPHLRTHKISPGVRRSCPPRGCYPGTTGRSYGHLGLS